jgi:hypothetical protein
MIINNEIDIKVVPATLKYWQNLGYDRASVGNTIKVKVSDLSKNSNIYVDCRCDSCNRTYSQRASRNTNICGYCISSKRMLGNKLGTNRKKYSSPSRDELLNHFNNGGTKTDAAKMYSVTIPVVNRWIKEHNISLIKHHGRKFFKTKNEENSIVDKANEIKDENSSISELSRLLKVPRHILKSLAKSGKIDIKSQFDVWKDAYDDVLNNMTFYVQENATKNLKTISEENNISLEHLKKAFRVNNIDVKLHSYNKSKGEIECGNFIKSLDIDCYSAMFTKMYEIDCFVPSKNFGVEYCGEYWHRFDESKQNKYYHRNKMRFAREKNISLMTIFESEWLLKNDIVKSMIRVKLGKAKRIYARKTVCKEVPKKIAEKFHENNHLSGYTNSSINLGLYHDNELVSVLSFIKSRFDKNYEYEISRFSTIKDHVIVGGLSKLFNQFVNKYDPKSCMTYSDLRVGEGKSYLNIGFDLIGETVPNYYYYHKNKGYLEPRMRYQKHKLKDMKEYSSDKTEFEIMQDSGYYILFDCGNKKYGWRNPTHIQA